MVICDVSQVLCVLARTEGGPARVGKNTVVLFVFLEALLGLFYYTTVDVNSEVECCYYMGRLKGWRVGRRAWTYITRVPQMKGASKHWPATMYLPPWKRNLHAMAFHTRTNGESAREEIPSCDRYKARRL